MQTPRLPIQRLKIKPTETPETSSVTIKVAACHESAFWETNATSIKRTIAEVPDVRRNYFSSPEIPDKHSEISSSSTISAFIITHSSTSRNIKQCTINIRNWQTLTFKTYSSRKWFHLESSDVKDSKSNAVFPLLFTQLAKWTKHWLLPVRIQFKNFSRFFRPGAGAESSWGFIILAYQLQKAILPTSKGGGGASSREHCQSTDFLAQ